MSDLEHSPALGDDPGAGRAPSVSRLWPETDSYALGAVLEGRAEDDRREARDLAADVKRHLSRLFGTH